MLGEDTKVEAREAAPGGVVGGAEPVENLAGCRVRAAEDHAPARFHTVQEAPRPVMHHEPVADVVGHHRRRVRVRLEDLDGAPSGEMYHSYARVPRSALEPETISSINSRNVSSAPSLTASSFTQETCPFIACSFALVEHSADEVNSGVVAGSTNRRKSRDDTGSPHSRYLCPFHGNSSRLLCLTRPSATSPMRAGRAH
jgi:hypothetical protein